MLRSPTRFILLGLIAGAASLQAAPPKEMGAFLENHCVQCHDSAEKKGGLDLDALSFDLKNPKAFAAWVKVHDRMAAHEMPPKKKQQPKASEAEAFLKELAQNLTAADHERTTTEGRTTRRRLNRYEYENTLRDLLGAPWLQVKEMLPEDGEAYRYNKVGEALDISHVQMAQYLAAADYALREVMATQESKPASKVIRYYAREQATFSRRVMFSEFNRSPERAAFPLIDNQADIPALEGTGPMTVGKDDPEKREREAMGVVASNYEPIEIKWTNFRAPMAGRYKIRFSAYSFWAGPDSPAKWWRPSRTNLSAGRTREPVTVYGEMPPRNVRRLGAFDITPEPGVYELDVWLLKGETIRPDASRLFRSRPGNPGGFHNPLAEKDGQPGVAYRWMEAEGPIIEAWPTKGQKLLFGGLPMKRQGKGPVQAVPKDPEADAATLMKNFLTRTYRGPVKEEDTQRFLTVVKAALASGNSFTDSMIAGYSAVLCSPGFVTLQETPGELDQFALASRLSYFLWNSQPDQILRDLAVKGELAKPEVLKAQTDRLLSDKRSRRFVDSFLDYWLDLRKSDATSPDADLYPDYYLDDLLVESALLETQGFIAELIKGNLPARSLVAADFAMINERLAGHYGLPTNAKVTDHTSESDGTVAPDGPQKVEGVTIRKVKLPADSPRGGLMTQASVLKVTANGTTTSPVLRGAWVMERVLGKAPPPPPPSVPAIEPDTRGAVTIREQLEKHRAQETCATCHEKMDPAGFALENFDILGGWRDQYRALGEGQKETGFGKNGHAFTFHLAQPVDAAGTLPGGGDFKNILELKKLMLKDERQIARNFAEQLIVFATGSPVRFGDRPELEQILDHAKLSQYGARTVIHEIVQSSIFRNK